MINQYNTTTHLVLFMLMAMLTPTISFAQDCTYNGKANDMIPNGKCAPVSVVWEVTYRDVDDKGTGNIQIQYDWDDGNPAVIADATLTNTSLKEWSTTLTHTYPNTGNLCNYHPRATLIIDGIICTSSAQEQIVTVWDTDDKNGGELNITPDPQPICLGNDALFNFTDNSQWNCTPPDEDDVINNEDRWIQWIYGTGSSTITDAEVGGIEQTYPWPGNINHITGPIEGPTTPYNTTLNIYIPDHHPVGAFFEVTLRNWNTCNPYDDPDIAGPPSNITDGDYLPVTTTAQAIIVPLPDASIQPVVAVCESADPFLLISADGGGQWNGPGISSPGSALFNPKLAGAGIHTITYSITDGNDCSDIGSVSIEVLKSPITNIAQGNATNLCPGVTLSLDGNPSEGSAPYTHQWTGDTSNLNNASIVNPDFSTLTVGTYQLIYHVEDNNSCFSEDTITIDVEEVSISFANNTIETCLGNNIQLNPNPSGGSETFILHEWTGIRTDKLSDTLIQTPWFTADEAGNYTFEYKVKDDSGCEDTNTITIIVHEQSVANAGINIDVCGLQTTLNATPSVGIGAWKVLNGSGILSFEDFNIPTPLITSDSYGTYLLQWKEDNNSCNDSAEISISFTEIPTPSVMENKDTCGTSMKLIAYPHIGNATWTMQEGPGIALFNSPNNDTTTVQINTPSAYKFIYTEDNGNGCIGKDSVTINFFQVPTAKATPPDAINCTPYEIQFENTSTYADSYYWDFGNGNSSNTENPATIFSNNTPNAVSFDITLIAKTSNACADTLKTTITVAPTPVAFFEINNPIGCSPLNTDLTNKSQGGSSYEWTYGDGSTTETTVHSSHQYTNNESFVQSFEVMLVTSNNYNCSDTSRLYTTVYPKQNFNLTANPDSSCSPLNISLVADPGGYIYNWDLGDGNINQGGNFNNTIFTNETNNKEKHNITLYTTSIYGCIDTAQTTITVLPSPTANFEPNDITLCSPKDVTFINNTNNITTSYWDFGDGYASTTNGNDQIEHTYINNQSTPLDYRIRLVTENSFGCKDSMDGFTSVNPAVTAIISGDTTQCAPFEATFSNQTIGANTYLWSYGDDNTSNSTIGQNTYINSGTEAQDFKVSMIASSAYGCSDTAYTIVTTLPSPVTYFEPNDFSVCSPKHVIFTNYTENITKSFWSFGDGTIFSNDSNDPTEHTYTNDKYTPLDYRIRLVTENNFGCKDSMDGYTSVNPSVKSVISGGAEGCSPIEVSLGNESIGGSSFIWDYDNGNTSSDYLGLNTFTNNTQVDKEYTVSLVAKSIYGCSDTAYAKITAFATPQPNFTATPEIQQMPASTVDLTNTTAGEQWNYEWDFGDDQTSTLKQPNDHTYINSGEFTITLRAFSSVCESTTERLIKIDPNIPTVEYGPPTNGCPSLTVNFYCETKDAESFLWEFGDGNVSADPNPTHTYYSSGEYQVKLMVTGPGGQTIKDDLIINAYPQPTAFFEAYPTVVTIPGQSVTFANKSVDADTYAWDFGNGTSSTERDPVYEYTEEGNYDVSLEASNEYGCIDIFTLNEPIIAQEGGEIAFPNAFTPNTGGTNSGEYIYGDKNNYIFYPAVQIGIATYKMQIFSRWGQLIFESNDINIGWDGYHKGKLCAQGVYIWKATCRFGTGQVKVYTGDVTLIR